MAYADANTADVEIPDVNMPDGNASAYADSQADAAASSFRRSESRSHGYAYAYADADAIGIYADRDVNNVGEINVTATGGTADAGANAGADAYADDKEETGADADAYAYTSAEAEAGAEAYGIEADGDVYNAGDLTVLATGGTASATASSSASAYADPDVDLYADDNAYAKADAYAYADAGAEAFGILTGDADDILFDYGEDMKLNGNGYHGYGYENSGNDVNNVGVINVMAVGGTADANALADADADAEGDDDSYYSYAYAEARANATAVGIGADGDVDNTGDITVTAIGGVANAFAAGADRDDDDAEADAIAVGIASTGHIRNSANLNVTAIAEDGFSEAYGFVTVGYDSRLTNTGIVRVTGDEAYEVYVKDGTTRLEGIYNATLDGDPTNPIFKVGDGATLLLNDATLSVTTVAGETVLNTPYYLFALDGEAAFVDGDFGAYTVPNPNLTVTPDDGTTYDRSDDTISLGYTPVASEAMASSAVQRQATTQSVDAINYHMSYLFMQNVLFPQVSSLLADSGTTAESFARAGSGADKRAGMFVEPYYSWLEKDADPLGYDADLWGLSVGYTDHVGDSLLGLYLGYGQADVDFTGGGFDDNNEEQDLFTAGFSGLTRWDPWTLRYGLTGFYGSHDYRGLTGVALDEVGKADFDSYGTTATVMGGYVIRRGNHVFLPEAGLNWTWVNREEYTLESATMDTTFSELDEHDLEAAAALRWLGDYVHEDMHVIPSASVGVRHLLTDDETSVSQSLNGGRPVVVETERDRTGLTLSGSLTLTNNRNALSVVYDGEYYSDLQRHNVWLRYAWEF